MNKFLVFPCVRQDDEEEGYTGPVVSLACASNLSFVLFFPISEDYSKLINYVLQNEDEDKIDMQILCVYKTMLDSWKAGDRFLSGIVMDAIYDDDAEEDIISPTLIISNSTGSVDAVLNVNFVHAILLAAMERKEIIVTNELIEKLLPMDEDDDDEEEITSEGKSPESKFPVDKQILDIARDIMGGKKNHENQIEQKKEAKPVDEPTEKISKPKTKKPVAKSPKSPKPPKTTK